MIQQHQRRPQTPGWEIGLMLVLVLAGVYFLNQVGIWGFVGAVVAFVLIRDIIRTQIKRINQPAPPPPVPADAIQIGQGADDQPVVLSERQLAAHGLILGATGSGKTTTLLKILCDEILRGRPVIALDLKGSQSFVQQIQAACAAAERSLHYWSPDGPGHWNPLAYGDASELKDKLISFERFSEPHYQRAAERYLQLAIQVLQQARPDRPVTVAAVVNLLEPNNLKTLLPRVPKEFAYRVGPYLSNLSRDQRSAIMGLQSRLALLSESTPGAYLQPGEHNVDPWHALSRGDEVILFSLNSSRYGKLAPQVAALAIQDLTAAAGYRLSQPSRPLRWSRSTSSHRLTPTTSSP